MVRMLLMVGAVGVVALGAGLLLAAREDDRPLARHGIDLDTVAERVERIRGIRFRELPDVDLLTRREQDRRLDDQPEADPDRAEAAVLALSLAGVGDRQDLVEGYAPDGVFDGDRIVLSRELVDRDPMEAEAILAHELAHALHAQRLGSTAEDDLWLDDGDLAALTLDEGAATVTELEYRRRHQRASGSVTDMVRALPGELGTVDQGALTAYWGLHYVVGARYVDDLRRRDGWAAVNREFGVPPETTAKLLHPDRAAPPPAPPPEPAAASPGDGATSQGVMEVGELDTAVIAQLATTGARAARAAAGTVGGTVAVWRLGGDAGCEAPCRRHAAASFAWRTRGPRASRLLESTLERGLIDNLGAERTGDALRLEGAGAAVVARGDVVRMAFAPSPSLAARLAGAS